MGYLRLKLELRKEKILMSADNWAVCPKCKDTKKNVAEKAYGKVPQSEYLNILADVAGYEKAEVLREDYEIGINELGVFYVSYECRCDRCGFKFNFNHTENGMEHG